MFVPFSVSDFIDRAETVYGERPGVPLEDAERFVRHLGGALGPAVGHDEVLRVVAGADQRREQGAAHDPGAQEGDRGPHPQPASRSCSSGRMPSSIWNSKVSGSRWALSASTVAISTIRGSCEATMG